MFLSTRYHRKGGEILKELFQNGKLTRSYHSDGTFGYLPKEKFVNNINVSETVLRERANNSKFYRLVTAYKQHGHKIADINPVVLPKQTSKQNTELDPSFYGLHENDNVSFSSIFNVDKQNGTVSEAIKLLQQIYAEQISAEFMYLENNEEIEWLSSNLEKLPSINYDEATKKNIAKDLLKSQVFDQFLASKFPGVKRYGGEGAESMMVFFGEMIKLASEENIKDLILAMPHRGRLNLLTGMLNFKPEQMFAKLKGLPDFPSKFEATGDVLSHCIASTDLINNGKSIHVSLLYNPSHLEAINPVSMGKARARHLSRKTGEYSTNGSYIEDTLNIQVHGDAAFSGQGINQETLAITEIPHFEIGGSIHLVVNNQVGFTTPGDRGRSSRYATDLAKFISAPVIHVNGDNPEMVLKASKLAFDYRSKFRRDIFIDMNCYRQWGHNELDDPTFTNPALYSIIKSRRTVPDKYCAKLLQDKIITDGEVKSITADHSKWLNDRLKNVDNYVPEDPCFTKQWTGFKQASPEISTWDTGLETNLLSYIGRKSVNYPSGFKIHPNLEKNHVTSRLQKVSEGSKIDWATAEAMAMGSLLYQGYNVRISGQDVGRGTFSHRHAMLVDQQTNNIHIPLNSIDKNQTGFLEIANSILSEEAVLGFEYGMSIDNPNNLIIWEAQFGDFFNGAQIIFDTFITSGETKWLWSSAITILLPHGYDGAGPEHSSSRIERFLQLTDSKEDKPDGDNINMQVCQPSTPAQYFHLLRRQMVRDYRKPLIIIAPKTLLRLSAATSNITEMGPGTTFTPVIGDKIEEPIRISRVVFCSGKHYYSLKEEREKNGRSDTALIRIESFCPFPTMELQNEISKYTNARAFIWSQEEPRNMGAWTFIKPRFENLVGKRISYRGRDTLATPAVGVGQIHREQAADVISSAFVDKV